MLVALHCPQVFQCKDSAGLHGGSAHQLWRGSGVGWPLGNFPALLQTRSLTSWCLKRMAFTQLDLKHNGGRWLRGATAPKKETLGLESSGLKMGNSKEWLHPGI